MGTNTAAESDTTSLLILPFLPFCGMAGSGSVRGRGAGLASRMGAGVVEPASIGVDAHDHVVHGAGGRAVTLAGVVDGAAVAVGSGDGRDIVGHGVRGVLGVVVGVDAHDHVPGDVVGSVLMGAVVGLEV